MKNNQQFTIYYDSRWELDFIKFCENLSEIELSRPNIRISYIWEGIERGYYPDFRLVTRDRVILIEIKPNYKYNEDERTKLKCKSGSEFVLKDTNDYTDYLVLTESSLYKDKNQKYFNPDKVKEILNI